jgi:hypothetical protein
LRQFAFIYPTPFVDALFLLAAMSVACRLMGDLASFFSIRTAHCMSRQPRSH